jgi:hypothetical protein
MTDATRLAIAILVLFLAMVAFFFAFHPNGVVLAKGSQNPGGALEWLANQFTNAASPSNAATQQLSTIQQDLNTGAGIPGVTVPIPAGVAATESG